MSDHPDAPDVPGVIRQTLYANEWVSLKIVRKPDAGVNGYVYSHETRCGGRIVAVLPCRDAPGGREYLVKSEVTPCWGFDQVLSAITGGYEGGDIEDDAVREMLEETGYVITRDELIPLGESFASKSADTVYSLFSVDLTGREAGEAAGDGTRLEAESAAVWVDAVTLATLRDPQLAVMYMRLGGWPLSALHARGEGIRMGESWVLTPGSLSYREAGERILSALDVPRSEWPGTRDAARSPESAREVPGVESPAPASLEGVTAILAALEGSDGEAPPLSREELGRLVREVWVACAREHPDPKPSWLAGWDELDEWDKETDRRIGKTVANHAAAVTALAMHGLHVTVVAEAVSAERERADRLRDRCDERDRLISALIAEHPVELGRFSRMLSDAAEPVPDTGGMLAHAALERATERMRAAEGKMAAIRELCEEAGTRTGGRVIAILDGKDGSEEESRGGDYDVWGADFGEMGGKA